MDRRRKVELFEEIRREYRFGVGTIQGVAKKLNTHRERYEVIQSGQVLAARRMGVEKQTKQVSETAKRAAMRPEDAYVGYIAMSI